MAIFKGSRYADAEVAMVEFLPGDFRPAYAVRPLLKEEDIGEPLQIYPILSVEELDNASFHYGDRPDAWWVVADLNAAQFISPFDVVEGTALRVPTKRFFDRL